MAKRITKVAPNLVGEAEIAFARGRQIHDGILIAFETIH